MLDLTRRLSLAAAAALLLTTAPAQAQAPAPAAAPAPVKYLEVLGPNDINPTALVARPPAEGSDAEKAELADLHRIIDARTPERLAQAKWDDDHEDASLFYATIGGGFDLDKLPATKALIAIVANDASVTSSSAKKIFARKRPWAVDPTIPNCDPEDLPLTSYPSGHAMIGYTEGYVLAWLIPEKAEAIQARAVDYAYSRAVCGAHFPSDTEASRVLGTAVATKLMTGPSLVGMVEASRAELRAAHFTAQ